MRLRGLALLALPCALYAAGEVREEVPQLLPIVLVLFVLVHHTDLT